MDSGLLVLGGFRVGLCSVAGFRGPGSGAPRCPQAKTLPRSRCGSIPRFRRRHRACEIPPQSTDPPIGHQPHKSRNSRHRKTTQPAEARQARTVWMLLARHPMSGTLTALLRERSMLPMWRRRRRVIDPPLQGGATSPTEGSAERRSQGSILLSRCRACRTSFPARQAPAVAGTLLLNLR